MPATLLEITEGWTGALPFTLKADGVAVDLTGFTVTMILRDRRGTEVDTSGDLVVDADQVTNPGKVALNPDAVDFVAALSPYTVRFKVVDGASKVVFFPNGEPNQINVHPA